MTSRSPAEEPTEEESPAEELEPLLPPITVPMLKEAEALTEDPAHNKACIIAVALGEMPDDILALDFAEVTPYIEGA